MGDPVDRVARALARLPDAGPGVMDRTAGRAGELAGVPPPRRAWIVPAVVAAAALGTGAALAGVGAIEVTRGGPDHGPPVQHAPSRRSLVLPPGAHGIAVLVGGRLHLRTADGVGIQGLRATAVELSPRALYVAIGSGRSLAAISPAGRRAWTHAAGGRVAAIAWSPYPVWVAYLVRRGPRLDLHLIEGDGDGDRRVARGVDAAGPYWSPDGTRLYFSRGAAWHRHVPALGPGVAPAPGCDGVCPPTVRAAPVTVVRDGTSVSVLTGPARRPRRLLLRLPDPGGPVRVSVR